MRWRRLYDWRGPFPRGFGCPKHGRFGETTLTGIIVSQDRWGVAGLI